MDTVTIIAHIIGFFGMASAMLSFQCRDSRKMFVVQGICALMFTLHFGLLGAFTGMLQNILAILRAVLLRIDKKWANGKIVPVILSVLFIITGIITYDGFFSIFPPLAMVVSTFVMWTKNGKHIRIAQLSCISPLWIIYNASVYSVSGCITETFNIISIIVSIIRYGINGFDRSESVQEQKDTSSL